LADIYQRLENPPDIMHYDTLPTFYNNQKFNLWSSGFMTPCNLVGGYQV